MDSDRSVDSSKALRLNLVSVVCNPFTVLILISPFSVVYVFTIFVFLNPRIVGVSSPKGTRTSTQGFSFIFNGT
jgi:hypothetical protein